jgi:hypothetical protein
MHSVFNFTDRPIYKYNLIHFGFQFEGDTTIKDVGPLPQYHNSGHLQLLARNDARPELLADHSVARPIKILLPHPSIVPSNAPPLFIQRTLAPALPYPTLTPTLTSKI